MKNTMHIFPPLILLKFIKSLANLRSHWNCTLEKRRGKKSTQSDGTKENHHQMKLPLVFAITSASEMQSRRMQTASIQLCRSTFFPSQYCTHALNSNDDDNPGINVKNVMRTQF